MIQKFIASILQGKSPKPSEQVEIPLVATALLIEVINADHKQMPEELALLRSLCAEAFSLSKQETEELINSALTISETATSLWEHTDLINTHLNADAKYQIVLAMWRLAYADAKIDKYEEHLIRKVCDLIYVPHNAFIKAKHEALTLSSSKQ